MNASTALAKWEQPWYSRLILAAVILAMLLASLPVTSVFAAGSDEPWKNADLEREWKNKLRNLQAEGLFYNQVQFYPADFEDSDDLARAWDLLHRHGFALQQANSVVFRHTGFDFDGDVINEKQAYYTLKDLAAYLHVMRGIRRQIAEAGYKIHRVR
jgi:hypothetical protein